MKHAWILMAALAVASTGTTFAASEGAPKPPSQAQGAGFPEISIDELKSAIAAKTVTLIDVNGSESWKEGHIPGAIDFRASGDKLGSLLPQDKGALVVAYCGGPQCNAYRAAASAAKQLGYTNVKHLKAGIRGWKAANEATEKAQ